MIQYLGNDTFDVQVGGINGEFSLSDLNSLLDELKELREPIAQRVIDDGDMDLEREIAFAEGKEEGKEKDVLDDNFEMCG